MPDRVLGADISHHNKKIDFGVMSNAGVKFLFVKASEGLTWTDPNFLTNWAGSKNVGLLRAPYHFWLPSLNAVQQARKFFDTVNATGDLGELPPILDVERKPMQGANIRACLNEIERLFNRRPMVYTAPGIWNDLGTLSWAQQFPLWVAQYPFSSWSNQVLPYVQANQPRLPKGWTDWEFWQFTETAPGLVYGAGSANIDLNHFDGDENALRLFAGLPPIPVVIPQEDLPQRYIAALNSRNPATVAALYSTDAVRITPGQTFFGKAQIQAFYAGFFPQVPAGARFALTAIGGVGGARQFLWEARLNQSLKLQANGSFGILDNLIVYHYEVITQV